MNDIARIVTRIDLDTAIANGADSFTDADFVALCDRFEALLEAECERLGYECEVVRDGRTSGAATTRGYGAAEGNAGDIVNAAWDRALAGLAAAAARADRARELAELGHHDDAYLVSAGLAD